MKFWGSITMWLRTQESKMISHAELSLSSLEECRKDIAGRKGMKELLLVGREKVPRGFGLRTGCHSDDTADGAGNCGKPSS